MENSKPETVKSEKVKPEKELCDGNADGLSQLREEESLGTIGDDMEDLHDEAVRETLAKDQFEDVRGNSPGELNDEHVGEVKETDSGKEDVVEVKVSPALTTASDTSMVKPSLSSDPLAVQGEGLSLLEKESDSQVVNNLSASPVMRTDSSKGDVVSAGVPVDNVAVENREVKTSPTLTPSSDPSMVKPSVPSDPATTKGQGQSLLEQKSDSRAVNNLSVSPVLRTPSRDGYNWRKYGQKQVKSPKGSRSYFRCTYSECCAKKIECSNDSGNMIEIVNKGLHSHEPPRKNSFSPRETRAASAITPVREEDTVIAIVPSDSSPSPSTKENIKRVCENEAVDEPEPKRRLKKDNTQSSDSVSKHGKKHKFVVHAADDVGISGDGHRWRKYGQKMVKGNPNPRNYYRCTSAGCPVRKHIETAVDNTRAVIITYKGEHNHGMPVPKKRHGPSPSSVILSAAAPTSGQCSAGRESGKQSSEALDVVSG